jgi:hypothetical protein
MFLLPKLRCQHDRRYARRPRAGRCPLVEDLEGRRLLSGSNIHHRLDAAPLMIVSSTVVAPVSDAAHASGGSGGGGGSGKV